MKSTITTIINGKVLGQESLSFNTKAEYDNYINSMIDYVTDKELDVEFNHDAFTTNIIEIEGEHISTFSSGRFKSIILDNCVAWEESGIITICSLEEK